MNFNASSLVRFFKTISLNRPFMTVFVMLAVPVRWPRALSKAHNSGCAAFPVPDVRKGFRGPCAEWLQT